MTVLPHGGFRFAGFEPVPDAMVFLAASPAFACPFLSGDEPKPEHVLGPGR